MGVKRNESCKPFFKELNILTLPALIIFEACCFVKNNLKNFSLNGHHHNYSTRNREKITTKKHKTARYESSPYYFTSKLYNALPEDIKILPFQKFKKELKIYLISKTIYDIKALKGAEKI